jgi:hypothetical protein
MTPGVQTNHKPYLRGGKLLIALIVVAVVVLMTLWITRSPEAAVLVAAPLLLIIGVDRCRT